MRKNWQNVINKPVACTVRSLSVLQLNKHETDPYFLQIFQSNTSVFLIISVFCKSCEPICEPEITPLLYHLYVVGMSKEKLFDMWQKYECLNIHATYSYFFWSAKLRLPHRADTASWKKYYIIQWIFDLRKFLGTAKNFLTSKIFLKSNAPSSLKYANWNNYIYFYDPIY